MIRVKRRISGSDPLDGFLVSVGRKWAVLARTMDGGYFDGYVAFRIRDVKKVTPDRSFQSTFSRSQPEWSTIVQPDFESDTTRQILRSMSARSPLIAIEKENERSRAMWIGEFRGGGGKWLGLHEVLTDAKWKKYVTAHKHREVTAISIESHYLTALAVVAGRAPAEM